MKPNAAEFLRPKFRDSRLKITLVWPHPQISLLAVLFDAPFSVCLRTVCGFSPNNGCLVLKFLSITYTVENSWENWT